MSRNSLEYRTSGAEPARATASEHYGSRDYDSEARFSSYWHQIDAVLRLEPDSVLEVGIGTGLVSRYLGRHVPRVHTVDLNPDLDPEIAGRIEELPVDDAAVDVVLCSEVLEHLPYEEAMNALAELRRVARRAVVVTVPEATPYMRLIIPIPLVGERKVVLRRWWARSPPAPLAHDQHYWELGLRGFTVRGFLADAGRVGLSPIRDFRLFGNPYHHLFEFQPEG